MSFEVVKMIEDCFNNNSLCKVTSIISLISITIPPIMIFIDLFTKKIENSLNHSLNAFIYGSFALIGIAILRESIDDKIVIIYLIIGLVIFILYTIILIIESIKSFSYISYSWKIARFIFYSVICIIITFCMLIDPGPKILYCSILILLGCSIIIVGIGNINNSYHGHRNRISLTFNFSMASMLGVLTATVLINIDIKTLFETDELAYTTITLIFLFLLQLEFSLAYFFSREDSRENIESIITSTNHNFGSNIKDDTELKSD